MSEQLLAVLKICLLALLYLFFLRVLRAVWAEVRVAGAPASAGLVGAEQRRARNRRRPGGRLVTLEPPDLAGIEYPLGGEVTIGRASGCTIVLDDTFLSQLHARVTTRGEEVWVEDLGSTNGTYVNTRRVTAPAVMRRGDRLQIGNVVMEMR